ncbi:MAG: hypothetical protein ABI665_02275 [Vicinamibacterales bacterium]
MTDQTWEVLPPEDPRRPGEAGMPFGSRGRLVLAFGLALVSDALSVWLEFAPPLQWGLDVATAMLLFVVLGRQWLILPALIAEAIPGVAVFPAWVLVVGSIAMWGTVKKGGQT